MNLFRRPFSRIGAPAALACTALAPAACGSGGDANWPKSLLYVAGWGIGSATLDGRTSEAGAVNPALQQLDFYVRSPERNEANHPQREVFDHFFAMEVTWRPAPAAAPCRGRAVFPARPGARRF